MRVLMDGDPLAGAAGDKNWLGPARWPAQWVVCAGASQLPLLLAFRLRFEADGARTARIHVSADERYELFLDGARIGRGPERGDQSHWFFETYRLDLQPGGHVLAARVWALGDQAPYAQTSVRPGFLLAAEGDLQDRLSTGRAPWECKRLTGWRLRNSGVAWGTGAKLEVDGASFCWGWERGEGDGWQPAAVLEDAFGAERCFQWERAQLLRPATLPAMIEESRQAGTVRLVSLCPDGETTPAPVRAADHLAGEAAAWQRLLAQDAAITLPPRTARRVIVDLENYYCAFPELVASGGAGASVRILWAESLFCEPECRTKGRRGEIKGKYFLGVGDLFRPDGGRHRRFDTLWWEAGRYLEIVVRTADEPLVLERLGLRETRYPLEMESEFRSDEPTLDALAPVLVRGLQMCAHETWMDCPYYEQLMYIGDTRLEVLCNYTLTRDDRLPRKALRMFDASRLPSGLTQSRYPSRNPQIIPPFSLWWVAMIHDYARWRDDPGLIRNMLPGARGVVDHFLSWVRDDGLLGAPRGWNFMDWVPGWSAGVPPEAADGVSGILNWHLVYALQHIAELEEGFGEPEFAARARRRAQALSEAAWRAFWDDRRGLLADDLPHAHFSEHSQCLAVLGGTLDAARERRLVDGLLSASDVARTTIYFTHYLFETCARAGRIEALLDRLGLWAELVRLDLKTPLESPEPSRSDCHAWGSHPLYHVFASLLGARPGDWGFRTVVFRPQLGRLHRLACRMVHPRGWIEGEIEQRNGRLFGRILLPPGVDGTLVLGESRTPLSGGRWTDFAS